VDLEADIYGSTVVYHGKIVGFGAGTGGAFALLPAQNASGNWIKIVQRIPVRIAFEPRELAANPLQIGLSMLVNVDTHKRNGERLPQLAQSTPAYVTNVFQSLDAGADARAKSIIAANEGETARFARSTDHGNGGNPSSLVGVDGAKPRPIAPDKPF
jgi:membrane fusion protein, multidrug efflux system